MNVARRRAQALRLLPVMAMVWDHPVRVIADEKGNRGNTRRNHTPSAGSDRFERCRMRRQSSPADRSGQTELIENLRRIVRNALPQNAVFPGVRRCLKSLQLPQELECAALARELRTRCSVLPAQKPAHELRWRDRLNLPAQFAKRQPVNARQQSA